MGQISAYVCKYVCTGNCIYNNKILYVLYYLSCMYDHHKQKKRGLLRIQMKIRVNSVSFLVLC